MSGQCTDGQTRRPSDPVDGCGDAVGAGPLDAVVQLAARLLHAPIVWLSVADGTSSVVRSATGLAPDALRALAGPMTDLASADRIRVVPDARAATDLATHPLVAGPPHLRFVVMATLHGRNDASLGALVVADVAPRPSLSAEERRDLELLVRMAEAQVESALAERRQSGTLASLQYGEMRHQLALQAAGDGVWDVCLSTGALHISPQCEIMLGYAPEEITAHARQWQSLVHPEDVAAAERAVADHLAGRSPTLRAEFRMRAKSGEWVWILVRGRVAERDGAGRPARVIGTYSDVTPRRRQEEELRQREARHRLIARATNDIFWDVDLVQKRIDWGDALQPLFGYAPDSVPPTLKWWQDHVHPDDRAHVIGRISSAVDSGAASWSEEYRFLRADGTYATVLDRGFIVRNSAGQAVRMVGVMIDLTALRQRERELQASENRYRTVVESVAEIIFQTDAEGRWTFLNPAWTDITGFSIDEALGRPFLDFVHPADRERNAAQYRSLLESGKDHGRYEVRYRTKDGGERWVEVFARVMRDEAGAVSGGLGILKDITHLKLAEAELRRAKEEAEAANRTKSEFLANMSHELRTPLNAIIGFSEIMRDELLGPLGDKRYRQYASDIHSSGAHLLEIINDILDLSKIEAGKHELIEETVELPSIVKGCFLLLAERAQSGDVALIQRLPEDVPVLRADPRKIKQILLNLLANAVKFTPAGGSVTVTAAREPDGGIALSVTDTGIGIDPEHFERVMAPFGQVDSGLGRKYEGTGLGLPLARAFTELHGGKLELASSPGEGTRVTIRLPKARVIDRDLAA
ncbi:MAG TPA: PAS domain-containing protein [Alphaproteobacteria bacterium]